MRSRWKVILGSLPLFFLPVFGFLFPFSVEALSPSTAELSLQYLPWNNPLATKPSLKNQCTVEEPNRPFPEPPADPSKQIEILLRQMRALAPRMGVRYEFQKIQELQASMDSPVISPDELRSVFEEGERNEEANCAPVDLRPQFPRGVLNQGQSNWCFSYIAADLLSFYTGVVLSPTDLAISQHRRIRDLKRSLWESLPESCRGEFQYDDSKIALESGNLWRTLNIAIDDGACAWGRMPADSTEALNKDFEALYSDFRRNQLSDDSLIIVEKYFKNVQLGDLRKAAEEKTFTEFLAALRGVSCDGEIHRAAGLKVGFLDPTDRSEYAPVMQSMEDLLDRGTPTAFGYGGYILWGNTLRDQDYSHTGILVGRRFNVEKRRCEYLIRNTWGPNYKRYNPDYESDLGHIWIPRDLFKTNLYGFAYLYR